MLRIAVIFNNERDKNMDDIKVNEAKLFLKNLCIVFKNEKNENSGIRLKFYSDVLKREFEVLNFKGLYNLRCIQDKLLFLVITNSCGLILFEKIDDNIRYYCINEIDKMNFLKSCNHILGRESAISFVEFRNSDSVEVSGDFYMSSKNIENKLKLCKKFMNDFLNVLYVKFDFLGLDDKCNKRFSVFNKGVFNEDDLAKYIFRMPQVIDADSMVFSNKEIILLFGFIASSKLLE